MIHYQPIIVSSFVENITPPTYLLLACVTTMVSETWPPNELYNMLSTKVWATLSSGRYQEMVKNDPEAALDKFGQQPSPVGQQAVLLPCLYFFEFDALPCY